VLIVKVLTLFIVIFPIYGANSDSSNIKDPKIAFFSSIFPGGGQIYNGKFLKGAAIIGLEVYAFDLWMKNSDIYSDYDNGNYPLNKSRYLQKRNKYAWWVIFLYFYGMIDALVDAHLSPFNDVMDEPIEFNQEQGVDKEKQ